MKMLFALILAALAPLFVFAQQASPNQVVGIWNSLDNENGQPLAVVSIKREGESYTGTVTLRGLQQGDNHNVTIDLPITNPRFDGKVFLITLTFPGPEKLVTDWELSLNGDNDAKFVVVKDNDGPVTGVPVFSMKRAKVN